jgi:hypothetical protein
LWAEYFIIYKSGADLDSFSSHQYRLLQRFLQLREPQREAEVTLRSKGCPGHPLRSTNPFPSIAGFVPWSAGFSSYLSVISFWLVIIDLDGSQILNPVDP